MAAIVSASASSIEQITSWLSGLGRPTASLASAPPRITLSTQPTEVSHRGSLLETSTLEHLSCCHHRTTSATGSRSKSTAVLPDQGPVYVLDSACIDTAIAIVVRARQQDSLGNTEAAGRLFAAALGHMCLALRNTSCIRDSHVRERLTMLRFLLEADGATAFDDLSQPSSPKFTTSSDLPLPNTNLRGACAFAASNALTLINQLVIMWLLLLGNLFVWLAVQFRQSMLPEAAAKCLILFGAGMFRVCKKFDMHVHLLHFGQTVAEWLVAVDRETNFSQKLLCSFAAVFGAIARVVEDSATPANTDL
ncbi:hypothetical protein COEREDRAFT_81440 [Coemansia reversa NRRL 1564]|uniref:Uncharacterized protein n=1 Tax=Coemansia reversa (strain ATCC 12441 / NRRL 1564) TaxID=763665 RepID=A0A2G5BBY8_COERN|nr:hypothetical protein COEREDRAFT_81440 [Coemansia reversa NRRL 1564]|eukprot:PIA16227.1 hypothetical protein COEREDRAFT_81440 [Coemansia reversa NRRL 1564]